VGVVVYVGNNQKDKLFLKLTKGEYTMENTKLIKKIKEYLDADIQDNNDLDAQAYAEQLMFWIENWEEQK
jgi:hypothetical protein